jgi:hypothetical protein
MGSLLEFQFIPNLRVHSAALSGLIQGVRPAAGRIPTL